MATRKELLLSGFARQYKCQEIASDLISLIIIFFYRGVVECKYEGKEFKDFLKDTSYGFDETCFSKILETDNIPLKLIATKRLHGKIDFELSIDLLRLLQSILSITISVSIRGNISELKCDQFEREFAIENQCRSEMKHTLLTINKNMNIGSKYDKFDIEFHIDIIDIKFHKMELVHSLKWKLNEIEAFNFRTSVIKKKFDNWLLSIKTDDWLCIIIL